MCVCVYVCDRQGGKHVVSPYKPLARAWSNYVKIMTQIFVPFDVILSQQYIFSHQDHSGLAVVRYRCENESCNDKIVLRSSCMYVLFKLPNMSGTLRNWNFEV